MKMPGNSLIAVASPIPTPAQRDPRRTANSRSATTSTASSMLIWPNMIVSRSGSIRSTSGTARAASHPRGRPRAAASGVTSHQVVTATAASVNTVNSVVVTPSGSAANGNSSRAANGGYVKSSAPAPGRLGELVERVARGPPAQRPNVDLQVEEVVRVGNQ